MSQKNSLLLLTGKVRNIEHSGKWVALCVEGRSKKAPLIKVILRDEVGVKALEEISVGQEIASSTDLYKYEDGVLKLFADNVVGLE